VILSSFTQEYKQKIDVLENIFADLNQKYLEEG
jgi:hypothetical protein